MQATFKLTGTAAKGGVSIGTAFVLGKPIKGNSGAGYYVLLTAAHVLDEISSDDATLWLHNKNLDGTYSSNPFKFAIRKGGMSLYKKHPEADVVAMYINLPVSDSIPVLPISLLADDSALNALAMHPGDELLCLGFPLGIDLNSFPVIRTGLLASYPITPSRLLKVFYYNFHVFPGNSGGPVFFSYSGRLMNNGSVNLGTPMGGIVGLVIQQENSNWPGYENAQMDISVIVPGVFIKEVIALLPERQ